MNTKRIEYRMSHSTPQKPFPALCLDCKHSEVNSQSPWSHRCFNPKVVSKDCWALAHNHEGKPSGTDCSTERGKGSWFAPCGMRGKLWEAKQ